MQKGFTEGAARGRLGRWESWKLLLMVIAEFRGRRGEALDLYEYGVADVGESHGRGMTFNGGKKGRHCADRELDTGGD